MMHHTSTVFLLVLLSLPFFRACEPLVTQFEEVEQAVMYKSQRQQAAPAAVDTIKVMTWNIRFGAGRLPWFGDSCGDRVILSRQEVETNLRGIAETVNRIQPDILMINEIDIESKRTAYIDEVQWLLDHTYFNYGTFASNWKSQFIPSDGLGRMNMGNAVLSRWPISEAIRIQLSLRGDQDALTEYFYLRRNILKTKINLPGQDKFYAVATHLSAFSTDDTKQIQVAELLQELATLAHNNAAFILGGDLNLLPPGAQKTDYCLEDKCADESFHGSNDNPKHKEGSYFTPEITWLQPLYDSYMPAVTHTAYLADESSYFTHSPSADRFWDRKLDYLFSNYPWISGSDSTHQDVPYADHVPVSAKWEVPR
jgi:endonuclease/exonuclease/phosphatase family metal-dependent hydrolase